MNRPTCIVCLNKPVVAIGHKKADGSPAYAKQCDRCRKAKYKVPNNQLSKWVKEVLGLNVQTYKAIVNKQDNQCLLCEESILHKQSVTFARKRNSAVVIGLKCKRCKEKKNGTDI